MCLIDSWRSYSEQNYFNIPSYAEQGSRAAIANIFKNRWFLF